MAPAPPVKPLNAADAAEERDCCFDRLVLWSGAALLAPDQEFLGYKYGRVISSIA